jgi:hypothetical protein
MLQRLGAHRLCCNSFRYVGFSVIFVAFFVGIWVNGGGKVGSTLGLVYVDVVEKNCGRVIQTSDQRRFCCKAAGACSRKGHKTKVNLSTKTLNVKYSITGQARISPKLSVDLLPDNVTVAELLIQDNSLEVWVAYFESLHAEKSEATSRLSSTTTDLESPWEEVKLPTLDELRKASINFKTPKKLRLGNVLNTDTIPVTARPRGELFQDLADRDTDDEDQTERTKVERALQVIMSDWNKLNTNFQLIYLEFDTAGRGETKYRNTIADTLGELQEAIRGTDAKMQLLGAGLGTTVTECEEGPISV